MQSEMLNSKITTYAEVEAMRDHLLELLSSGYENPYNLEGTLALRIAGHPKLEVFVHFHSTHFEVCRSSASPSDAELTLSVLLLTRITREYMFLNWCDQDLTSMIEASGRLELVEHFGRCLLHPQPNTLYRYLDAQKKHFSRGFRMANTVDRLLKPTQQSVLIKMNWGFPFVMSSPESSAYTQTWTLQRLIQYFGDEPVKSSTQEKALTLREFVVKYNFGLEGNLPTAMPGMAVPYTQGVPLQESMRGVFGPAFFQRDDFFEPKLWLGSLDASIPATKLHRDPHTSFLFQIMGNKLIHLFSADQSIYLYPYKAHNNHQPCWFRPDCPDFVKHPKAQKANKFVVELEPGDVLVIPYGWFHQTHLKTSPNMSISYPWKH